MNTSADIHLIDEALHSRTNFSNTSLFTSIQELAKVVAHEALKETERRLQLSNAEIKLGNPEAFKFGVYNFIFKQLLKENIR